jgi:transposase InsO family protein
LQPHRSRTFKHSKDPEFADKLRDMVGLYMDPPAHAVVLSIDEKSQIQPPDQVRGLDRTQPGLPLKPSKCGTMTHDYKRHGTTTLFAALNVLENTVFGRCIQRHRHKEFFRFLNAIEREVPAGKLFLMVLDNVATHKTLEVMRLNILWCSDGFAFACGNVEIVRVGFVIDAHDREIIAWRRVADGGISGSDVHDMMLECVEKRFATIPAPHPVEWLSDNGSPYMAKVTRDFATQINQVDASKSGYF